MTTEQVTRSEVGTKRGGARERKGVLILAGAIVTAVVAYVVLNTAVGGGDSRRGLLPYQTLAATLPDADQQQFRAIREGLLPLESERARSGAWPDAAPASGSGYRWSLFRQGAIVNYFGQPADASQPAWLLEIQEPEPGMPPDPSPTDDEHHRLPDGTVLHIYVWSHALGAQLTPALVRQPQSAGWTEVFNGVPNPVYYNRR